MRKSILIVGAGITGIASAEWLRREGCQVTVIDPVLPGQAQQTSFGNAGLLARTSIVPLATPSLIKKLPSMLTHADSPLFLRWSYLPRLMPWAMPFFRNANSKRVAEIARYLVALTSDTNEQHGALSKGTGAEAYLTNSDFIHLFPQQADYDADALTKAIQHQYGMEPHRLLTRNDLLDRDPYIGPTYNFGTVFSDFRWLTSPGKYLAALFEHFCNQGGKFHQAVVKEIHPGGHPSVRLEDGKLLYAEKIILAAGIWSHRLLRNTGVSIKLEAERGYHVAMHSPSIVPPCPYMITDAKFVLSPMLDSIRAAGVIEFSGIAAPAAAAPAAFIAKSVRRVYPTVKFASSETWMGRRPTTPDSLPIIGESSKAANLLHAYGGQHIGLTIGAKVGKVIADMVAERKPSLDLHPYRPDRF